jgi:hypothetical protein
VGPRNTLYPQKLALSSPTSGGRPVGIVRLRTKATEFSLTLEHENEIWGEKVHETDVIHRLSFFLNLTTVGWLNNIRILSTGIFGSHLIDIICSIVFIKLWVMSILKSSEHGRLHLEIQSFWILSIVRYSEQNTAFWKLDLLIRTYN